MQNNNRASIRRLSNRSLKNNGMRNFFAVLAIILTGMLFTAAFSLVGGMIQVAQEQTMHEVGGRFHAGLKSATMEQYEKIAKDPLVERSGYNIYLGVAENIRKRQAEIRYLPEEKNLEDYFIELQEGHLPAAKDEILVDTFILDELKLPYALGETVPLKFSFMGQEIEKEFTVSGWYQGDAVSHASELFVSEGFWDELRDGRSDEDFVTWSEEHPEDNGVGLLSAHLFFKNTSNLEDNVRTVIANAGYEPETEVNYGVNWAYMQSRMDAVDPMTLAVLACAVAAILLTGYLIIYNIFQISVMSDIRFYGLLKTIGTTKKQIKRMIRRQVLLLSGIGIPIGLLAGYGIGKAILPYALSITDTQGMEISMKFHPMMLVFGAGFSAVTVFLSCRKPGKIAGSVSPIEAVKYTEAAAPKKKRKKRKVTITSMAFSNLGRNKKKTGVVVAAISFSIIILTVVMTGVGSFRMDRYFEQRIAGDFVLGSVDVSRMSPAGVGYDIDQEYLKLADSQEGIQKREEMWWKSGSRLVIDEKAREAYRELDARGMLLREEFVSEKLDRILAGEQDMDGYFYGYSDGLLKNLKVLDGSFDAEQFQSGDYVLLTTLIGNEHLASKDNVYHPGDRVTVQSITEDSKLHEVRNEEGETVDVWYDNLASKEYEVMAIVDIPDSMNLHRYQMNVCDVVLPMQAFDKTDTCFAYSYQVEEEKRDAFEAALKDYTENVNTDMGYLSKNSLREEFQGMVTVIGTIGIALSVVIALIGILNFINASVTGIISRKHEFAMLQSIGMTKGQLRNMLICEGISYVGIAGVISFFLGSILAWAVMRVLNNVILFFEYRFQITPFLIMMPVLLAVSVAAPVIAFGQMEKKSIVERLREAE